MSQAQTIVSVLGFQLGVDALVTRFAGFANDYFKMPTHPLETMNRGTLFLPFEAFLTPLRKEAQIMRIVVAALNGPDLNPLQRQTRFQALADLATDGRVATKYGRGGHDHMQAFNTLEQLLDDGLSPDRLETRSMPFPHDLIETDIMPSRLVVESLRHPVFQLRSTKFKLKS